MLCFFDNKRNFSSQDASLHAIVASSFRLSRSRHCKLFCIIAKCLAIDFIPSRLRAVTLFGCCFAKNEIVVRTLGLFTIFWLNEINKIGLYLRQKLFGETKLLKIVMSGKVCLDKAFKCDRQIYTKNSNSAKRSEMHLSEYLQQQQLARKCPSMINGPTQNFSIKNNLEVFSRKLKWKRFYSIILKKER